MSALPHSDFYAELVLEQVPLHVRSELTPEQLEAIREAVGRSMPRAKHDVDLRFVIPLWFTQYYVVLFAGRDRRRLVREVLVERRGQVGIQCTAWGLTALLVLATLFALAALYVVKSYSGIDLFPGHLRDYIPLPRF